MPVYEREQPRTKLLRVRHVARAVLRVLVSQFIVVPESRLSIVVLNVQLNAGRRDTPLRDGGSERTVKHIAEVVTACDARRAKCDQPVVDSQSFRRIELVDFALEFEVETLGRSARVER